MRQARAFRAMTRMVCVVVIGITLVAGAAAAMEFTVLEEPAEAPFSITGYISTEKPAELRARMFFNRQPETQDHFLLAIDGTDVRFMQVQNGTAAPIGIAGTLQYPEEGAVLFTLQRREWGMAFIWDNEVVARAYNVHWHDGEVGYGAAGGQWDDVRVQPVGEIFMRDDFVREEGAGSAWEPLVGNWEMTTLRDDEQAEREQADLSINAFAYLGKGTPEAISVIGYWFWDSYVLEAAVQPLGDGAAGLVFYLEDEENYLLVRWTSRVGRGEDADRMQIIAVRHGEKTLLAETDGGYIPGQWYNLKVAAADDTVQVYVDDALVLRTMTNLLGQGQGGVYAEGSDGALFDDIAIRAYDYLADGFTREIPGKWSAVGGSWLQRHGALVCTTEDEALSVSGKQWTQLVLGVDTKAREHSGVGVVIGYSAPQDYLVFRWAPAGAKTPYAGRGQIVRVTPEEGARVLAEGPAGQGELTRRVRVLMENGVVRASLNGGRELQAVLPEDLQGSVGFYSDGGGAFDNIFVTTMQSRQGAHVTEEFAVVERHPEMADWAADTAAWIVRGDGEETWWTKGDYLGDTAVSFRIPDVGSREGKVRVTIGGYRGGTEGSALVVSAAKDSKELGLSINKGEEVLAEAQAEVEKDAEVVFAREGHMLVVRVNGQNVLWTAPDFLSIKP